MKQDVNVADVYFIFADNRYEDFVTYERFKALLKFYALLYDRVIIPDSYLINNHHLLRFMVEDDGLEYIHRGIIVPTIRANTASLTDVYQSFGRTGTLISHNFHSSTILDKLEQIDLNKSITWKVDEISRHFTTNVLEHIDTLPLNDEEKQPFFHFFKEISEQRPLTRLEIYDYLQSSAHLLPESREMVKRYVDIHYNFNIPNFLGSSAAYPEKMNIQERNLSPESVYFNQNLSALRNDFLHKEEFIETSFFNQGILAVLTVEQISHLRGLKEHRRFLSSLKKTSQSTQKDNLENRLIDYVYTFEKELPVIISSEVHNRVKKEKLKLAVQTLGRNTIAGDGVGQALGMWVLDSLTEFVGAKAIGSLVNILLKPLSQKTETEVKKLELKGRRELAKVRNQENITDTMKSFSINTLQTS